MTSRGAASVAVAFIVGLNACENTLGPESVRSVEVEIDRTVLVEGESMAISVSATEHDGGSISGSEVTWISRDPTTVRVEDGSVYAVAPGVARVVADVRGVRDSVRIRVRFADLARGEIGVRVQRDGGVGHATGGYTLMHRIIDFDGLPGDPGRTSITTWLGNDSTVTGTVNPGLARPDTLVWITFGGDPEVGARQLAPFVVDTLNGTLLLKGSEGAMVRIPNPETPLRTELYTPVDVVDLEIDEVTLPDSVGGEIGFLRGAVAFEAAGLVIEIDTVAHKVKIVGPASENTLRIYAEFETQVYQYLSGMARVGVVLDGETVTGYTSTGANVLNGGTEFRLPIATSPGPQPQEFVLFHTRVEATAQGRFSVQILDADTFDPRMGGAGTWSYATIQPATQGVLPEEDIDRRGYSASGEIVLSEYTPPTSAGYGMIRGTYTITYELRDDSNVVTGDTMEGTAEFVLPIHPLCGPGRLCE